MYSNIDHASERSSGVSALPSRKDTAAHTSAKQELTVKNGIPGRRIPRHQPKLFMDSMAIVRLFNTVHPPKKGAPKGPRLLFILRHPIETPTKGWAVRYATSTG
jgi:hypothetical protein